MPRHTPVGPNPKLAEIFAKRNELKTQSTHTNATTALGSPFLEKPRISDLDDDNDFPLPFKRTMPKKAKKSDVGRITPALMEASARLQRAMMEPEPELPKLQESRLKRQQQKKDSEKAEENNVRFKGPFLKPFDEEEAIESDANTQNSASNHHCGLERVFWGDAIALRLRGRVNSDGNEDNHEISKHLMIPVKTTGEPASSTSSTDMPPPQREISKGFGTAAAGTGVKQDLQMDEPIMAFSHPSYAESVSSPVTGHVEETMHQSQAPQKAIHAPPAPYESSMSQKESMLSAILSSRPNPKDIIYTHRSQPLFLPPEFVVEAKTTTKKKPAKKRRSRPTADGAHLMMSDDDGKLQPLKKQRSVKLGTDSMGVSQGTKSTTTGRKIKPSPLVPTCDGDPNPLVENEASHDPHKGQIALSKLSPYVSSWNQVPKASSEKKVASTLSPYVSTWDQQPPNFVSENKMAQKSIRSNKTLPVESKPDDFYAQDDNDADAPKAAAGGSASHVLEGENLPTSLESAASSSASFPKEESDPSEEGELEMADSDAKESCAAGLQIKN